MLQEELTKKYQRKMWKSIISRKKLDINMWDLIQHKNEKVYYMPYNGYCKFEVNTRTCLKCNRELDIGFRKQEFIVGCCECSKDNKNHATINKLATLFSEEKAKEILDYFAVIKTRKFPNRLQYWIDKGYTKEEAEEKVSYIQTARSSKSPAAQKGMTEYTCRRPEFWVKRGYSEEEALQKISELQIGNGLQWYERRYGKQQGKELFNKRIQSWQDKMIDLYQGVSKVSVNLFEEIDPQFIGKFGKYETTVRGKNKVYRVDYYDKKQRKIIEFFGEYWHADPEKFSKDDKIRGKLAKDIWGRDEAKIKDLQASGFKVLIIKERDYYNDKEKVIKKCLGFLNET